MFELANTSLPNGLIPGTHGFATVAMTKGLPDALRQRLEALCAYTHRQSAHDERYFRENPVNWFHVALPNGEHAVGRVAACDFDYTGRTNRLARMLVFPPREMPCAGAARVLSAEKARLSAPWDGEPRWLAPDAATATRLASSAAPVGANPSTWTAKFGPGGATLAQRFALLLEKCVRDGGKPIYFKTSAASDPDGTGLLSLFADLIDLLPPELRSAVTFSTYPDALSNGTRCHLRGAFDGDRAFTAASTSQPWVDCDHGRVMHEELLPAPKAPPKPVASKPATSPRPTQPGAAQRAGAARPRSQFSLPQPSHATWLPPERKSDRNFYIALGSFVAVVLVVFGAALMFMSSRAKKTGSAFEPSPVADVVSDGSSLDEKSEFEKAKKAQEARENREKRDNEEKKRIADKMKQEYGYNIRQAKATNEVEIADESHVHDKLPDDAAPNAPQGLAFLQAKKVETIRDNRLGNAAFIQEHQMMKTFFYDDAQCATIKEVGKVEAKRMPGGTIWTYTPNPSGDDFRGKCKGMFVIFYDPQKQEAFWLWQLPGSAGKGEIRFDSSDECNLQQKAFGCDEKVSEFYMDRFGQPTYTLELLEEKTTRNGMNFVLPEKKEFGSQDDPTRLSLKFFEPDKQEKYNQFNNKNREISVASNKLERVESAVRSFNMMVDSFMSAVKDLKTAIKYEDQYKKQKNDEKDKEKKKEIEEKLRVAKKEVSKFAQDVSERSKAFGLSVDANKLQNCNNDDDVDLLIKGLKVSKKDAKIERRKLKAELDEAINALDNFEADWQEQWSKRVKASKFAITNVVGDKENKGGAQ